MEPKAPQNSQRFICVHCSKVETKLRASLEHHWSIIGASLEHHCEQAKSEAVNVVKTAERKRLQGLQDDLETERKRLFELQVELETERRKQEELRQNVSEFLVRFLSK
jgi:hypothetical protein